MRWSCQAVGLSRTVYAYQPRPRDDGRIIKALTSLAEQYPRFGFGKLFPLVRGQGHGWNHKRVYRVYCALKLNIRGSWTGLPPGGATRQASHGQRLGAGQCGLGRVG